MQSDQQLKSSSEKFCGIHTITDENNIPYMTRYWFGRLRIHVFHRGDNDKDFHDHPWDFYTIPLQPYVERVLDLDTKTISLQVVPANKVSFRPATHTHQVLGRFIGKFAIGASIYQYDPTAENQPFGSPLFDGGPITTIVWRSKPKRAWGFWKFQDRKWSWVNWKEHVNEKFSNK